MVALLYKIGFRHSGLVQNAWLNLVHLQICTINIPGLVSGWTTDFTVKKCAAFKQSKKGNSADILQNSNYRMLKCYNYKKTFRAFPLKWFQG